MNETKDVVASVIVFAVAFGALLYEFTVYRIRVAVSGGRLFLTVGVAGIIFATGARLLRFVFGESMFESSVLLIVFAGVFGTFVGLVSLWLAADFEKTFLGRWAAKLLIPVQ